VNIKDQFNWELLSESPTSGSGNGNLGQHYWCVSGDKLLIITLVDTDPGYGITGRVFQVGTWEALTPWTFIEDFPNADPIQPFLNGNVYEQATIRPHPDGYWVLASPAWGGASSYASEIWAWCFKYQSGALTVTDKLEYRTGLSWETTFSIHQHSKTSRYYSITQGGEFTDDPSEVVFVGGARIYSTQVTSAGLFSGTTLAWDGTDDTWDNWGFNHLTTSVTGLPDGIKFWITVFDYDSGPMSPRLYRVTIDGTSEYGTTAYEVVDPYWDDVDGGMYPMNATDQINQVWADGFSVAWFDNADGGPSVLRRFDGFETVFADWRTTTATPLDFNMVSVTSGSHFWNSPYDAPSYAYGNDGFGVVDPEGGTGASDARLAVGGRSGINFSGAALEQQNRLWDQAVNVPVATDKVLSRFYSLVVHEETANRWWLLTTRGYSAFSSDKRFFYTEFIQGELPNLTGLIIGDRQQFDS
jgi:hypothetical protein